MKHLLQVVEVLEQGQNPRKFLLEFLPYYSYTLNFLIFCKILTCYRNFVTLLFILLLTG